MDNRNLHRFEVTLHARVNGLATRTVIEVEAETWFDAIREAAKGFSPGVVPSNVVVRVMP